MDRCTFSSLVQHGGDAEDEVFADVGHRRLDDALAVLQTTITLECFPAPSPTGVASLRGGEDLQILTVRHQHDLRKKKATRVIESSLPTEPGRQQFLN